jgi:dolichol-phosphate mannosyltransferase
MTRLPATAVTTDTRISPRGDVRGVSVVIPCFNEIDGIETLIASLDRLIHEAAGTYDLEFLFVDDGSTDQTFEKLRERMPLGWDCVFVEHARNLGIAQAIRTGLRRARHDFVCSMDFDCTYDPCEFLRMIPLLEDDVDVVTASPYHPRGKVIDVPRWRLLLSRMASWFYRFVSRQKLHTYTSCFRVYRRSAVLDAGLSHPRFVGIAEMLLWVDRHGGEIVEYPTVLRTRTTGHSKMKTWQTILAHLALLVRAASGRVTGK